MENEENPVYTITGKIDEVSEKPKSTGGIFKKIKIQGMTFNVFDEKWFDFLHIGEIIKASYNKTTKGEYTYKNIFFIIKATEQEMVTAANARPVPTVTQGNTTINNKEVDWDGKEKRIIKENVLNRAVDMFIADKIEKEEILRTADNFLDWVYDKFPKKEEIKSIDEIEEIEVLKEVTK